MQKWRSPKDYYWENRHNKFLRKPAAMIMDEKQKQLAAANKSALVSVAAAEEAQRREEEEKEKQRKRNYERPWLHNFVELAADEIRFEQELLKQTAKDKGEGKNKNKQWKGPPGARQGKNALIEADQSRDESKKSKGAKVKKDDRKSTVQAGASSSKPRVTIVDQGKVPTQDD